MVSIHMSPEAETQSCGGGLGGEFDKSGRVVNVTLASLQIHVIPSHSLHCVISTYIVYRE